MVLSNLVIKFLRFLEELEEPPENLPGMARVPEEESMMAITCSPISLRS